MNPTVSICIPTYKQTALLKENLVSICGQTVQALEVLVSDDSPNDDVENLVQSYANRLPLSYVRNRPALGSPANWNAVLKKAKGDFVLLLHHDDRFAKPDSLEKFLTAFRQDATIDFCFGRNETIEAISRGGIFPPNYFNRYYADPSLLVVANTLGAPSNVLLKREAVQLYDERFKWIVDVECYARLFKERMQFAYVDEHLIKTGRHEGQITNQVINDSNVLLNENIRFAIENISAVKDLAVYDFYWRLLRNTGVKTLADIVNAGILPDEIPTFIRRMTSIQRRLPVKMLRTGAFSKLLMTVSYLLQKIG